MVNQSKINDSRYWKKWKESGAVMKPLEKGEFYSLRGRAEYGDGDRKASGFYIRAENIAGEKWHVFLGHSQDKWDLCRVRVMSNGFSLQGDNLKTDERIVARSLEYNPPSRNASVTTFLQESRGILSARYSENPGDISDWINSLDEMLKPYVKEEFGEFNMHFYS